MHLRKCSAGHCCILQGSLMMPVHESTEISSTWQNCSKKGMQEGNARPAGSTGSG